MRLKITRNAGSVCFHLFSQRHGCMRLEKPVPPNFIYEITWLGTRTLLTRALIRNFVWMAEPPTVSGVSPREGFPGTKVTIRGENLGNSKGDVIGNQTQRQVLASHTTVSILPTKALRSEVLAACHRLSMSPRRSSCACRVLLLENAKLLCKHLLGEKERVLWCSMV